MGNASILRRQYQARAPHVQDAGLDDDACWKSRLGRRRSKLQEKSRKEASPHTCICVIFLIDPSFHCTVLESLKLDHPATGVYADLIEIEHVAASQVQHTTCMDHTHQSLVRSLFLT